MARGELQEVGERIGASAWAEAPQGRVLGHAREEELPVPALGDYRDPPRPVVAEEQGTLPGGLSDDGSPEAGLLDALTANEFVF